MAALNVVRPSSPGSWVNHVTVFMPPNAKDEAGVACVVGPDATRAMPGLPQTRDTDSRRPGCWSADLAHQHLVHHLQQFGHLALHDDGCHADGGATVDEAEDLGGWRGMFQTSMPIHATRRVLGPGNLAAQVVDDAERVAAAGRAHWSGPDRRVVVLALA